MGWWENQQARSDKYQERARESRKRLVGNMAQRALEKEREEERWEALRAENLELIAQGNTDVKPKESMGKYVTKADQLKARKKELDDQSIAYCPKCLSTSVSAQKKGVSIIKGLIGGAIIPVGILVGGIGRNKIQLHCMKCGNKFKA